MTKKLLTSLLVTCPFLLLFLIFGVPCLMGERLETTQESGQIDTQRLEPSQIELLTKGAKNDRVESSFTLSYPQRSLLPYNKDTSVLEQETRVTRLLRQYPWSERKKIPHDISSDVTPINARFRLLQNIDRGFPTPYDEGAENEKRPTKLQLFLLDDEEKKIQPLEAITKKLADYSNVLGAILKGQQLTIFWAEEHTLCAYAIDLRTGQASAGKKIKSFPEDVDLTSLPYQYFHEPIFIARQYQDKGDTHPTCYRITDASGRLEEVSYKGFEKRAGDALVSGLLSTSDHLYFVDYPLPKAGQADDDPEGPAAKGEPAKVYQYDFKKKQFVPYLESKAQPQDTSWYTTPAQLICYEQTAPDKLQVSAYDGQKAAACGQRTLELRPHHGSQIMSFYPLDSF